MCVNTVALGTVDNLTLDTQVDSFGLRRFVDERVLRFCFIFILSTLKRGRVGTPLMCLSVCPSVTTDSVSKNKKEPEKKVAGLPLGPRVL